VGHAHGQSVHRDFHHEAFRDGFEVDRVVLKAGARRKLLDAWE
jgi:hypothetical protein